MEGKLSELIDNLWSGLKAPSMVLNTAGLGSEFKSGKFSREYSETSFWRKITKYAKQIGKNAAEKALILYFCARDSDTPKWVKRAIIAVLGYFIVPIDAIPDFIPPAGFTDDIALIVVALGWVAVHVKDEHKKRAQDVLKRWFD